MKIEILIIALILISGCKYSEVISLDKGDKLALPEPESNINNETNTTTVESEPEFNGTLSYFAAPDSFMVLSNETSIVIDSGMYSAVAFMKKYDLEPSAFIVTVDSPEKIDGAKEFIMSMKPKAVYDNGLPTPKRKDYTEYNTRMDIKEITINREKIVSFVGIKIHFFAPFEDRFFVDDMNKNSIVVKANDVLYMSNCYKECEDRIDTDAEAIILANQGKCPTTSVEFILNTGASTIAGTEFCPELDDLKYFGIDFKKIVGVTKIE